MTDVLDLLTRRNPVDEAALPVRDERATTDLARIMAGPASSAGPPRRRTGRTLRLAMGAAGIASVAVLMGGLFVFAPRGPRSAAPTTPSGPVQASLPARDLVATIRVEPHADGPSLEETTRRAAEILNARAAAYGIIGAKATVAGPGEVRFLVPYAGAPANIRLLLQVPRWTIYDLGRSLLGDSRDRAAALRALEGDPSAPRSGETYAFTKDDWYVSPDSGEGRPIPIRTVRPQAGRIAIPVEGFGIPRAPDGAWMAQAFMVLGAPPVARSGEIRSAQVAGRAVVVQLRRSAVARGHLIVVLNDWIVASAPPEPTGSRTLRLRFTPGVQEREMKRVLTGGGIDANLVLERVSPVGSPRVRIGDRPVVTPRRVQVTLIDHPIPDLPDGTQPVPLPSTLLRVIGGTDRQGRSWDVWEVLTAQGDSLVMQNSREDATFGVDCVISWSARIIRRCTDSPSAVSGVVAPTVSKVVVRRADGAVTSAILRNGWFFAGVPAAKGTTILALDKDGKVLREIPR